MKGTQSNGQRRVESTMRLKLWGIVIALVLMVSVLVTDSRGDESPGFFLKITKNVPRLGKRNDREYDSYFMKSSKTVPRIGRSEEAQRNELTKLVAWLWDADAMQPSKRRLAAPSAANAAAERELSVVQPVNSNTLMELLDRDAIPSEHVKFVHWKDFDRALLSDADLYEKVILLGRKPDQRLKQDLNLGSFVPIFGNAKDDAGDFMLYNNKDDRDLFGRHYPGDFMQYNHLK